jgi:hypothetical protein
VAALQAIHLVAELQKCHTNCIKGILIAKLQIATPTGD